MPHRGPRIFYGWWIVAVGTLTYALGYGARYGFAVIFPSLVEEFGWSRDVTATVLPSHMIVYGLVAPVVGGLVDRFGAKPTMSLGVLMLSSGLALSSLGHSPWHFWLSFGLLFGAGLCLVGAVPFAMLVRNWFERKRGMAFSFLYLGSGGSYAVYPAVSWFVEMWGWRKAFVAEALILLSVLIPLFLLFMRQRPEDSGAVRDGRQEPGTAGPSHSTGTAITASPWVNTEWTLGKAMAQGRFWFMCLATFSLWGITQHIVMAHNVAYAVDLGLSRMRVSSVLSLMGVAYVAGALSAPVSDRIGREATISIAGIFGCSGILALASMGPDSSWLLYVHALAFGFGNGLGSPTIAAAVTDLFQGPRVGPVIGFIWLCFALGGCLGPWLGGWIFEATGQYRMAFLTAIFWYGVACASVWAAGPRRVRPVASRGS